MNFILGGTHGLGAEIAAQYQAAGEETFVVGRSYQRDEHGLGMAVDLAEDHDAGKLTGYINEKLGETVLKRFFWVAGYGYVGDFAEQPDVWRMTKINYANVMPIAQAVWRNMLKSEVKTNFVVISSTTAERIRNNETTYASTKRAEAGFAENLGSENERLDTNIAVSLVLPGGMQTPFWDGDRPGSFNDFLDPVRVAKKTVEFVSAQDKPFDKLVIERGSL